MVAVTYGSARVAAPAVAEAKVGNKAAKKGQGFFARLYDAIMEAQMKRAMREIALHRHLLPPGFVLQRPIKSRREDEPLGGW